MTGAESKKRKVLIVSFGFPPTNASGAVRVGKLAKYLPEFGWEPTALTVDNRRGVPQTLAVEIDERRIVRIPYFDLGSAIHQKLVGDVVNSRQTAAKNRGWRKTIYKLLRLAPSIYGLPVFRAVLPRPISWYRNALKAGRQILNEHKFDAIFSSYSPPSSHFVASYLQKESGIPWVAEFRDLWSMNPYSKSMEPFQFMEKQVEKRVIRNSCLLVGASQELAQQLQEIHSKKVVVLPNGFDEEDYLEEVPLTSKFTITYTGNIYPGKRDPSPLFEAIAQLKQEGKIVSSGLEVRFFGGNVVETITPLIEKYNLQELVKIYGFVPFKESIRSQKESSVLLLLSWNNPKDRGTLTGKIFEYLGAGRPILAIAFKGGEIDNLLQESGCGIVANEPDEIKSILIKWLEEFRQYREITSYYAPKAEVVGRYTRREQTRKLAGMLDETLAQGIA